MLPARRLNTKMADIVNKGIQFQEIFGTKFAAEYMGFHKVSIDVTIRVLTRPGNRRNQGNIRALNHGNLELKQHLTQGS